MIKKITVSVLLFLSMNTTIVNSENSSNKFEESIHVYEIKWKKRNNIDFIYNLARIESGNRYDVVNSFGYEGAYQFSRDTRRRIGIDVSRQEFLADTLLQDTALILLMEANKKTLQPFIDRYDGKYVHGVKITESGILAGAHLLGPSAVIRFLRTGNDASDGFGTRLTRYLRKFQTYSINL